GATAEQSIISADPPRHTKLRSLILKAFTPKVVAQLEPRIQAISDELVDGIRGHREIELVESVTIPLPMIVIAELLGIDSEKRRDFKRWSDDMVSTASMTGDNPEERIKVSVREFNEFIQKTISEREKEPKGDILSSLLSAELEGAKLTPVDVLSFASTLLIAGNETTTALVGNALISLTDHPEQYEAVRADRSLIPGLVEEVLRYQCPVQNIVRKTKEDAPVAGETIPSGATLMVMLGSANRDESRFPDPDKFDIRRDTKGHLAFGFDIHFCLGAALARLEAKVLLEALLTKLPQLERKEQDVAWVRSLLMRAPQSLVLTA
ncbi:MAG TPA: cytochrome P450, partial [Polyangiaceae bacterium]|nr:cytochrome P450 [Polyangiaceae bacterium]